MNKTICYADVWALLRKLGFDCDLFDDKHHRVCEYGPTDTRIVLHDYPPATPVRSQILFAVRLQLDNGDVMSRAEFDQWAARHTKNGAAAKRTRKKRAAEPSARKS